METAIHDGDLLVFRANGSATRKNRSCAVPRSDDPATGGDFTVKRCSSEKHVVEDGEWKQSSIVLLPLNKDFEPTVIPAVATDEFQIVAEFISVIPPQ
jgi:SOS-response transcriptional repressor LexA